MSIEDFPMDVNLAAEVVVRFKLSELFTRADLGDMPFEGLVRSLIEDEGLWGIADDNPTILSIKVWQS